MFTGYKNFWYHQACAWALALPVFMFLEWQVPGFVSYVFPFPVLVLVPVVLLFIDRLTVNS